MKLLLKHPVNGVLWVEPALHVAGYVVVGAVHDYDGVAQRARRLLDEVLEAVVGKVSGEHSANDVRHLDVLEKEPLEVVVAGEGVELQAKEDHVARGALEEALGNLLASKEDKVEDLLDRRLGEVDVIRRGRSSVCTSSWP